MLRVTVENTLTKLTSSLQMYILETLQFIFDDALQERYLKSNNGFKSAMFNVVGQAFAEVIRSGCVHIVLEACIELLCPDQVFSLYNGPGRTAQYWSYCTNC